MKYYDNSIFNQKDNPFSRECKDCIKNIWEQVSRKTSELNQKCFSKTYISIEKIKDNSII